MSSSLADKLKALGVNVGADHLSSHPKERGLPIEEVVHGEWIETQRGQAFISEDTYPPDHRHGQVALHSATPLQNLAYWAGDERIREMPIEKFAFLDTETSGLAGGTGTYAFLVGIGRFAPAQSDNGKTDFRLRQFFMRDPAEEAALLEAMIDFLAPCEALVTFNGKAFDAPLLATRYSLHTIPVPFKDFAHVDLLPLARRLWRDRLPSRALKYLEEHILFAPRTIEEVPGYEIPFLYFDYLRSRDAEPLKGVFYHNAMDILAMTALFNHTATILANPHQAKLEHGLDVVALAKLFEDLGKWDDAAQLYERSLKMDDSPAPNESPETSPTAPDPHEQALRRFSTLQRRRGDLESAVKLWEQAAAEGDIQAHIALAKHYEHRQRNYDEAIRWAESALVLVKASAMPSYMRQRWTREIEHRLARLEKKIKNNNIPSH